MSDVRAKYKLRSIQLVVILSNQVKNITENNRIGGGNQLVTDISSLSYDVDKAVPVIHVHDLIRSILENLEIIMTHFIGEFSGFQILAPQQHIGIFLTLFAACAPRTQRGILHDEERPSDIRSDALF